MRKWGIDESGLEYDTAAIYIAMEHVVHELREHNIEDYCTPYDSTGDSGGMEGEAWGFEVST